MILSLLISFCFSVIYLIKSKTNVFVIFYLSLLPFVVFAGQPPFALFLSLLMGYLLYELFHNYSPRYLLIFVMVLGLSLLIYRPRLGLDFGSLNSINSQRGEHTNFQTDIFARLIHNKAELSHSFVKNIDKLLSPVAVFASGFWHQINAYYPLGYLFPWDIYFIFRYLQKVETKKATKNILNFVLALALLLIISGLIYVDQAMLYSFSVIYFLALLAAGGYSSVSKKTQFGFVILTTLYLLYHLQVSSYFHL